MSVYAEMRAILALGLKPNEMKVWMTYRVEMDEEARQVRGKSQAQLREVAGISESQFSAASGSLQKLGLISVQRFPNAAQIISIAVPNSEGSVFRNPEKQEFGTPEIRNSEPPKSEGSSLYTAPVSTPKSALSVNSESDAAPATGQTDDPNFVKCKLAFNGSTGRMLDVLRNSEGPYGTKARAAAWLSDAIDDHGAAAVIDAFQFMERCQDRGDRIRDPRAFLTKNARNARENAAQKAAAAAEKANRKPKGFNRTTGELTYA